MADNKTCGMLLSDKELENIREYIDTLSNCNVAKEQFPYIGKCYGKSYSNLGITCERKCIYCSIWTSLPDGASLAITYIFGCSLYGYDKRIKE